MTLFGTYLTVQNAGTIESTGNGGLHLLASMENSGLVVANAGTLEIGDLYYTHELTNSGTIESTGAGDVVVEVAIVNTGVLSVQDGRKLTADGAVSGNGVAVINVGSLDFASSFNEAVTFTGAGTLELAQSQGFTNSVTGFSGTGTTALDLGDIGFVSPGEATYSGNKSSGVLTVTDGTHTAKFNLKGNYLGTTFVASSDGHGGTDVVAQGVDAPWGPVHAFAAAMAGIGLSGGQAVHSGVALTSREILLTSPRVASA